MKRRCKSLGWIAENGSQARLAVRLGVRFVPVTWLGDGQGEGLAGSAASAA